MRLVERATPSRDDEMQREAAMEHRGFGTPEETGTGATEAARRGHALHLLGG